MSNGQKVLAVLGVCAVFGLGYLTNDLVKAFPEDQDDRASLDASSAFREDRNTDGQDTTVDTTRLSEEQRRMLAAFGIDDTEVVITAEMMACAEAEVGTTRFNEIRNGDTPSLSEGAALLGCYR